MTGGRQPSADSVRIRAIVLDVIELNPDIVGRRITQEVEKQTPVNRALIKNAIKALIVSGEVHQKPINRVTSQYRVTRSRDQQIVRRIAADRLPKLSGPIRAPMDWCLHALQGAGA